MHKNYVNIPPVSRAMLLHLGLDCLVDFDVKDIRYDFDRCTVETGAVENMGVAVGILHVSLLEPELRGGVKFHPMVC